MKFEQLLLLARNWPIIDTRALLTLGEDTQQLSVQLARWVAQKKILSLRRGLYLLTEAYRKHEPAPEVLANLLVTPSYVSLERALAVHGVIPESVPRVLSVTTRRPCALKTPVGEFVYRYVQPALFFGFVEMSLGGAIALVARPEKALLDLVHLSRGEYSDARIEELRLQNLDALDPARLQAYAARFRPRVRRFSERLLSILEQEKEETL